MEGIRLNEAKHESYLQLWRGRVMGCRNSGKPIAVWCEEQGINECTMIKKFEVENYKGFSERLIWDLTAREYAFNRNLIQNGIVNKALVYGKNGTGNTSLGLALFDITFHLTDKTRLNVNYLMNYRNMTALEKHEIVSYHTNNLLFSAFRVIYVHAERPYNLFSGGHPHD